MMNISYRKKALAVAAFCFSIVATLFPGLSHASRAFNQYTTAFAPVLDYNRFTRQFTQIAGRFDVGAGGVLGSIPEPSSIALLLVGFGGLLVVLRRQREPAASAVLCKQFVGHNASQNI